MPLPADLPPSATPSDRFVQLLTQHQTNLRAFVYSLVGDWSHTADILQNTNLKLWEKADQFDHDRRFLPWAFAIARFEVLSFCRDAQRERLRFFAEVVEQLAEDAEEESILADNMLGRLASCLGRLAERHRAMVEMRYWNRLSVREIAEVTGRTEDAIKSAMLRARKLLHQCLTSGSTPG